MCERWNLLNSRTRGNVEFIGVGSHGPTFDGVVGGGSDHGAVVGAELWLWEEDLVGVLEGFLELRAEKLVGGNAAGKQDGFDRVDCTSFLKFLNKNFDGSELETGGEVKNLLFSKMIFEFVTRSSDRETEFFLDGAQNGGLEATKGEIKIADVRNREFIAVRVALFGGFGDGWATRVGEAKDLSDLIETLADGVIASSTDDFEVVVLFHVNNLGVATGDNGGKKWEFGFVATEPVGINVRFEVVGRVEWNVVDDGNSPCGEGAN